ncbi:MAG: c-type cytochrome, partial [Pirellulales bacterium]
AASQILARTMRRFASTGARQDLLTCAALFDRAPDDAGGKALMQGFEEAFAGRPLANLPDELASVLDRFGGGSVVLGLRQGRADAIEQALAVLNDDQADRFQRLQFLQIVGEVKTPACLPALLRLVAKGGDDELRVAALSALQLYDDPRVPQAALGIYSLLSLEAQSVAQAVLGSRKAWALALLEAVEAGQIDKATIPVDTVRKLTIHRDDRLAELVAKHWGTIDGETTAEMKQLIERLVGTVSTGSGSPYDGKKLYTASCGKCHTLLGQGGKIGPDLTAYKRDDFANMLVHIVNPSAEIREGFGTYVALTADGRAVTGFLADKDNQIIVLRTAEGQSVSIPQDEIDELLPQKKSLMPEGLLKDLSEQQVRDLFAYLRSTQPLSE